MIDIVVFSRNRPLQLFALLESLAENTDFLFSANISVIYRYDSEYLPGIQEIKERFSWANLIDQTSLKDDTLECLTGSDSNFCMFLVDDIVIKDTISFSNICEILKSNPSILTLSLRMGLNLDFCYPTNSDQNIPNGVVDQGFFVWDWRGGSGDWGYPLSVDGHVFRKQDMINWISQINFSNPNQFEDFLQSAKSSIQKHLCICYASSKIVNIPINRVQDEYKNRSEEIRAEDILAWWNEGKKIDISALRKIRNNSAHFATKISLVERR